jgi:hypothetical protein
MPSSVKLLRWACFLIFTKSSLCQSLLSLLLYCLIPTQPCRTNEIIIPHQTTLLKLLDSYLQSLPNVPKVQVGDILRIHESLGYFLAKRFFIVRICSEGHAQVFRHDTLRKPAELGSLCEVLIQCPPTRSQRTEGTFDKTSALQQINLMLIKSVRDLCW